MIREELVSSAVTFLRDPAVATAPIQKKMAFLQSKNLTQEEVSVALQRVGEGPPPPMGAPPPPPYPHQGAPYPQPSGYNLYGGYWPPPQAEIQRRDWRDWFIMATVMGGVGYGIYETARRYVVPLIKPPTPPQIEQDKALIDEEFSKAFTLLDQLVSDTEALKVSEAARTEKLDKSLDEVEQLVKELRHQDRNRQDVTRQTTQSVRELHEAIPAAVTAQLKLYVKPLEAEMKSLRTLIDKRLNTASPSFGPSPSAVPQAAQSASVASTESPALVPSFEPMPFSPAAPAASISSIPAPSTSTITSTSSTAAPSPSGLSAITARGASKASIPSWQKAASQRAGGDASSSGKNEPSPP